jgi:hypothetical protein
VAVALIILLTAVLHLHRVKETQVVVDKAQHLAVVAAAVQARQAVMVQLPQAVMAAQARIHIHLGQVQHQQVLAVTTQAAAAAE